MSEGVRDKLPTKGLPGKKQLKKIKSPDVQSGFGPIKALVQRFKACHFCGLYYRLSEAMLHINSQAHDIKLNLT